ncbi:unnamed protein product [Ilex paraguariensis]|uniref:Uncharacterized protein n=1 Tax=Ilex paraguariensis TaxID=185542 RepID=A0ABC8UQ46_9AQUA
MPEEAPVIRTTLPETSSENMELTNERKSLRHCNGGTKSKREKKVAGGATKLRNWWIKSMASFRDRELKNNKDDGYACKRKCQCRKVQCGVWVAALHETSSTRSPVRSGDICQDDGGLLFNGILENR